MLGAVTSRVVDLFGRLARSMKQTTDAVARPAHGNVRLGTAGGSVPELSAFVRDHYDRLVRLAGLVCRSVPDAEDAVQNALERAWRNQGGLRDADRLKPWLDRIVVREAIRLTRSRESLVGRLFRRDEDIEIDPVDVRGLDPGQSTDLREAYARLSAEQRAVVALHLYLGYSMAETADLVGAPIETARSRLRLAKQGLRMDLGST
jgi:RNA polymerase sigma-70 factor, ECF subfamily